MQIHDIEKIGEQALKALEEVSDLDSLKEVQTQFLGRKAELNMLMRELKDLSPDERKKIGALANAVKAEISEAFGEKEQELLQKSFDWEKEKIDITLPGKKRYFGHLNPITQVKNDIYRIFTSMGFEIFEGPEIVTEWFNFDSLNFPKNHPARDMQDAHFLKEKSHGKRLMPRSHTSAAQVEFMQNRKPPFKMVTIGNVFRNETTDASHESSFLMFEALVVGKDITVGNFKFFASTFFSEIFKKDISVRLRPSYFPFTEPSFEFDISCLMCGGEGCRTCGHTGWLEMGGAGMVNQAVLEAAGYKRNEYQGFAWGFGVDRMAMMKYKIEDIRLFRKGDIRFVRQF